MKRLAKLAGLLFCMTLLCALMVTSAWAESTTVTDESSLKSALSSYDYITLDADIDLTSTLKITGSITHDITIDLNGHIISGSESSLYVIRENENYSYTLTIKDSTGGGSVVSMYDNSNGSCYVISASSGSLIIDSGTFKYYSFDASSDYDAIVLKASNINLLINGGTFSSGSVGASISNCSTTINNVNLSGSVAGLQLGCNDIMNIYGGSYASSKGYGFTIDSVESGYINSSIRLYSGTYSGYEGSISWDNSETKSGSQSGPVLITGNKYPEALSSLLPSGYCFLNSNNEIVTVNAGDIDIKQSVTVHAHSFDNWSNGQRTCSICGTVETCTHNYNSTSKCTVCDMPKPVPVVEKMDVSTYRANGSYTYPTKDGYVFAGWYTNEACSAPLGHDVTTGDAYARFVDSAVLTVKWQVSAGTTESSTATDLRVITSVDSLNYSQIGFKMEIGSINPFERTSKTVYSTIYATVGNTTETYTPSTAFCTSSVFFLPYTITGIPSSYFNTNICATPTWVTLDGTTVYGIPLTFMISSDYNRTQAA